MVLPGAGGATNPSVVAIVWSTGPAAGYAGMTMQESHRHHARSRPQDESTTCSGMHKSLETDSPSAVLVIHAQASTAAAAQVCTSAGVITTSGWGQ